jgi:hypothetical protein
MSGVLRFLQILFAYGLTALVAGYGATTLLFMADPSRNSIIPLLPLGAFASMIIALYVAIPALLLVGLAEHFRIRSVFFYSGIAIIAGVVLGYLMTVEWWLPLAAIGLGLVCGGLFWALAGRRAGVLRDRGDQGAQKILLVCLGLTGILLVAAQLFYMR